MKTKILYHRYQLRSPIALNAAAVRREHEGFLIIRNGGVGCVHPWPDFGDASVDEQLETLRSGGTSALIERALHCCQIDASARREGRSLFEGITIPESHVILSAGLDPLLWEAEAELAERDGFRLTKIKCGFNPKLECEFLKTLTACGGLRFRLDFNAVGGVAEFLEALDDETVQRIDFIEDPMTYDAGAWSDLRSQFGVRLALDFESADEGTAAYDVRVLKPARENPLADGSLPVVITTVMDHPVGQMYAAFEAARFSGKLETCGLMTHTLFEPDEFIERVHCDGNRLLPSAGVGLGFDDLLESLPWKEL